MEKVLLHQKQLSIDQKESYTLEYWLVSRVILDEWDNEEQSYGVEIVKLQNGQVLEKEGAYCLCGCKEKIESWIAALALGDVTPATLLSLADDFVSLWEIAG